MAFNGAKLLVLATTHLIYMHATGFLWFVPNSDPLNLFTGRGSTPKKLKHTPNNNIYGVNFAMSFMVLH